MIQDERWKAKKPREPMACAGCGIDLPLVRHYRTYLCGACKLAGAGDGFGAQEMVRYAIKFGYLKPLDGQACVDCGEPARAYDHRDYNKPLEVAPVCIKCNIRRGPAIPRRA